MSLNFDDILVSLQGVTVLAQPRVSRETMIDVLREQTLAMKEFKEVSLNFDLHP